MDAIVRLLYTYRFTITDVRDSKIVMKNLNDYATIDFQRKTVYIQDEWFAVVDDDFDSVFWDIRRFLMAHS